MLTYNDILTGINKANTFYTLASLAREATHAGDYLSTIEKEAIKKASENKAKALLMETAAAD